MFATVPIGVAMLSFIPAIPAAMTVVFEIVALHEFGPHY